MAQVNMVSGDIRQSLVNYSVPLILGNVFQLTYHFVDSVITGKFIGKKALAAAGIASPVMNILILGISGLSMGAGVLMSEYFGENNILKLKKEMSTVLMFGIFFSGAAAALGVLFLEPLLVLLNVPKDIMKMTAAYLKIIFLGIPFTYFYNALSAALKSVGDSKTPLKFLMVSSLLNLVLDFIFIGFLGFGIVCSAVTTVIAEGVSSILSVVYIYWKIPELALKRHEVCIEWKLLKKTIQYGSVTALQQSCQPIGKLLIQGCVNSLGVDVIAAYNAVTRIDDFAFTPEQSISHGITTFVAQNRGKARAENAQQSERIWKGFRTGIRLEIVYWIAVCLFVLLFKRWIMLLFVDKGDAGGIVEIGSRYLSVMAFFYLFPALTNGVQGFFRGFAKMKVTLLATFIQTSIRVVATYLLVPKMGIYGIPFACAAGWSCMLLYEVPYSFWIKRRFMKRG